MQSCCPSMLTEENMDPNYSVVIISDESPRSAPTTSTETQEYTDYIASGVFGCLLCGELFRWHKCRVHMMTCCPEDVICRSIDELKELSEVNDNEIKAAFAEAEHQRLGGVLMDGNDAVYKCLFCNEEFVDWKQRAQRLSIRPDADYFV